MSWGTALNLIGLREVTVDLLRWAVPFTTVIPILLERSGSRGLTAFQNLRDRWRRHFL